MEAKFCLGDKVRVVGSNIEGTIVSIQNGGFYRQAFVRQHNSPPTAWDDLMPGWENRPVYSIFYHEPQWILSKEEYMDQIGKQHPNWPEQYIEDSYNITYVTDLRNRRYYMSHMEHQLEIAYAENSSI